MADEWFVAYAITPTPMASVVLFSLAHAVELYLKACFGKTCGTIEETVRMGHDLPKMWQQLKTADPTFMPGFEIRKNVYEATGTAEDDEIRTSLSPDDWTHFLEHRELYLVMKYVVDLKYLGGPMRIEHCVYLSYSVRGSYWIRFLNEIRSFLMRGESEYFDHMSWLVHDGKFSEEAKEYLRGLGLKTYRAIPLYRYETDENGVGREWRADPKDLEDR